MSKLPNAVRCGVLCGLALLVAFPATADEPLRKAVRKQLRDKNYMLIEDGIGARLYVFSTGNVTAVSTHRPEDSRGSLLHEALEMTRSVDSRMRVRGLTLLSGVEDLAALDAALVLLADPVAAVREEAVQLIFEHPESDVASIAEMVSRDPSSRVRQAAAELIAERAAEQGG